MSVFKTYIEGLRENRPVGTQETSAYGVLQTYLNGVGATLKPTVRCILHPAGGGSGLPDGGLFTREQLNTLERDFEPRQALALDPQRGVLEVKGTGAALSATIQSEQVGRYLARYGRVLVTNYREFAFVERGTNGERAVLETYSIAAAESDFWTATANPIQLETAHGERLEAWLQRALLRGAPLTTPEAVAGYLASCAREAKARVAGAALPALDAVRESLEISLGLSFTDQRADQFFRSSLVQTLFYGIFSAWVLWAEEHPPSDTQARFIWREAVDYLRVPVIQELFHLISNPATLRALDLVEPINWAADALNRVQRASFFQHFEQGDAVLYFYEPFLEAFDPDLRKQLGVWYTPQEIVRYMVARVDRVLRDELGAPDGLADPRVYVLDPCCGTGTYLVEVLKTIHATLQSKPGDALGGHDLKTVALERVFGFEILPAPFVVAHLQLGLLLRTLGAPLTGVVRDAQTGRTRPERAGVFLTNALTGWGLTDGDQIPLALEGLRDEREAAHQVKSDTRILVVIGNPPYDGYAGVAMNEETGLVNSYRTVTNPDVPRPEGQGLNDLYVRFFRMAERKIVEGTGEGIVCYISNYSWLEGESHPGMRERYLQRFDRIWIDCLNGDRYRTGKVTPDGEPDPSVFSSAKNRVGIQVGTAISLLTRRNDVEHSGAEVLYRDLWGRDKLAQLAQDSLCAAPPVYESLQPPVFVGLPLQPCQYTNDYATWPRLTELFPESFPGVTTSRDEVVLDFYREPLIQRMERYFDPNLSNAEVGRLMPQAMKSSQRFQPETVRSRLVQRGFLPDKVVRYNYRPFDMRWLYWEPETKLLDEKRADFFAQNFSGNLFLFTTGRTRKLSIEPAIVTEHLSDYNLMDSGARGIPLYVRDVLLHRMAAHDGDADTASVRPNLSGRAASYLESLSAEAADLFFHALALLHSPEYRGENLGALRLDWPRIVLPSSREALHASAQAGHEVAALLDPERSVPGVAGAGGALIGGVREELSLIGSVARAGGGQLDPLNDLQLTAGWGSRGANGVQPGSGRVTVRAYTPEEVEALRQGAAALGLTLAEVLRLLGEETCDVYLNTRAFWQNVPVNVWSYTLGGYPVVKKWLSYRESPILGRALRVEEAREVSGMARRIAALLLMAPRLDANYEVIKATPRDWSLVTAAS